MSKVVTPKGDKGGNYIKRDISTNRDNQISPFVKAHGGTSAGHKVIPLMKNAKAANDTNPVPLQPDGYDICGPNC